MKKIILAIIYTYLSSALFSQTYTIIGNAFLEDETNHSEVNITLNRTAPSDITYTFITDNSGAFSEIIEEGIYNITYSKDGYASQYLTDLSVYANIQLDDITMLTIGISSNLSGTLESGTYIIGGDIIVPSGEILIIEPGTSLYFRRDAKLIVNGQLLANGTKTDSILFTQKDDGVRWGGIHFSSHEDNQISYCRIEYSNASGVNIINSDATIHHSDILRNTHSGNNGGGINIENGNAELYNLSICYNIAGDGGGISIMVNNETVNVSNCRIFNNTAENYGGGLLTSSFYCENAPTISNSIICNNVTGSFYSGGIHEYHCSSNYINNIIYNSNKFGIYFSEDNAENSYVAYNNVYGNPSGNLYNASELIGEEITTNANGDQCDAYHNIQEDPLFVNASGKDFHLLEGSPCIDAGLNSYAKYPYDLEDNNRIWSTNDETQIVDMGVFEFGAPIYNNIKEIASPTLVYPNPTNGILNIDFKELKIIELKIIDIHGKTILTNQNLLNEKSIDLTPFQPGLYILVVRTANQEYRSKIILK